MKKTNMTREDAIKQLKIELSKWESECKSYHKTKDALKKGIEAPEQEPILDKVYADIQKLRGCSCSCSDGIIDDVEDILDKYKAEVLKQESCEDIMTIHTQGLDEEIRCTMCTNSMKSDRGCDGGCMIDKDMYEKVMDIIRNRIVSSTTPTRKKGHWIMTNNYLTAAYGTIDYVKCSCCGEESLEEGNYCPNCGVEMERM